MAPRKQRWSCRGIYSILTDSRTAYGFKGLLTGRRLTTITDRDLDGVAGGGLFGNSLYVNNARYEIFPSPPDSQYWVTKLSIRPSRHKSD